MNKTAALKTMIDLNKVRVDRSRDKYGRSVTLYTVKAGETYRKAVVVLLPKTYVEPEFPGKRVYLVNDWTKPGNAVEGDGIFHRTSRLEADLKAVRIVLGLDAQLIIAT